MLALIIALILQNKKAMKALLILLFSCLSMLSWGQEDYVLETRFRNPIDTAAFSKNPTMLLFVHSQCKEGRMCPTMKMQKALESDSLGFRSKYGIKLYVIYPKYSEADINTFDSFAPQNATVAFYTSKKYEGTFSEKAMTPYIVFYDGKGHLHKKEGGTIEELNDSINTEWRYKKYGICPRCNGTGRVKPNRHGGPDESVGICSRCGGKNSSFYIYNY